jgi:hypothetical protein
MEVIEKMISLMEKLTGLGRHLIDLASYSRIVSTLRTMDRGEDLLCRPVPTLLDRMGSGGRRRGY